MKNILYSILSKFFKKMENISINYENKMLEQRYKNVKFIGKNSVTDLDRLTIGEYSCIKSSFIDSSGTVEIGKYVHGARNISIYSSDHLYNEDYIPFSWENKYSKVTIKDFVWLGEGVKILPGVTIGEGAIVAMGSIVTKDVDDLAIVAGNPAKVLKYRNKEIYMKNKKEKKFREP